MKRLAIIISIISAGVLSVALADTPAQLLRQAEEALNAYRFDRATSQFNAYQAALKKAKLPVDSAALSAARSIPRLRQALEAVENLTIFDSLAVEMSPKVFDDSVAVDYDDADNVAMPPSEPRIEWEKIAQTVQLPASVGKLMLPGEAAFIENPDEVDGLVFLSADGVTALWSAPGSRGRNLLYEATRLVDGSWDVHPVTDIPSPAYSPFLLEDGMTLYYTTDAYPSLGGRDVMMSIRDDITEPWREPANLGMPVNSPADELLYVVDAVDSIGWFVTMRTGQPVVYTFKVNDMRENLATDDDNLSDRARISEIATTWPEDFDRKVWLDRVSEARQFSPTMPKDCNGEILPDGRTLGEVYESADASVRTAIDEYEAKQEDLRQAEAALAELRESFGHGDRSAAMRTAITDAETNVDLLRARILSRRNKLLKNLGYK